MRVYATTEDLTASPWLLTLTEPAAAPLLARASLLVRHATLTARYPVDPDGLPTSPVVAAAMRDATCAQVAAWTAADVDPAAGGVQLQAAPVSGKSLGTASISYDTAASASVTAMTARTNAATRLSQDAVLILADAGLLPPTVPGLG